MTEELREREKYFANAISLRNKELLELRHLAQAYVNERNDCVPHLVFRRREREKNDGERDEDVSLER